MAAKTFLPYAEKVIDVLKVSMASAAADVDAGAYPGDEDNLEMDVRAMEHIVETSAARGIDTSVPELAQRIAREAIAAGHGRDGLSRVIEVLRR